MDTVSDIDYMCKTCNVMCGNSYNLKRHKLTSKHRLQSNPTTNDQHYFYCKQSLIDFPYKDLS